MKTIIGGLVGLVIGAGGMYMLEQGKLTKVQEGLATVETQLSDAKASAEASAAEVTKLQDAGKALQSEITDAKTKADAAVTDLDAALTAKTQEVLTLQGKVTELEAALTAAKAATGTAQ